MPRNGSGDYSLPVNSWNPAINGVSATPADWQALINDVAAAIQASVSSDGQTPMTGDLAMGGYRLTGSGAPSGAGMSLRWEQLIQGADISSAASITIPLEGIYFAITGTTAITSFAATIAGRLVYLKFDAGIVLTNSASLMLPGAANITTLADDIAVFLSLPSGVWRCVSFPAYVNRTPRQQLFTASGTFTGPPGVTTVYVTQSGGGGGGGASPSSGNGGGGGGGGGWSFETLVTVTEGETVSVVIGAAGAGSTSAGGANTGGAGGTTSFGAHLVTTGGGGGVGGGGGGLGGTGTYAGGQGDVYNAYGGASSSSGGTNPFSVKANIASTTSTGSAFGFGGGGGGGKSGGTAGGGNGSPGFCLVRW